MKFQRPVCYLTLILFSIFFIPLKASFADCLSAEEILDHVNTKKKNEEFWNKVEEKKPVFTFQNKEFFVFKFAHGGIPEVITKVESAPNQSMNSLLMNFNNVSRERALNEFQYLCYYGLTGQENGKKTYTALYIGPHK